jgi:REP element-mobilizing transposase RayT
LHLLLSLPTTMSVAKAMQLIKGGSSAWAHETFTPLGSLVTERASRKKLSVFVKKHGIGFEERCLGN